MAGRGPGSGGSGDFPADYIDIVNEINDFIASLDAPPLAEHTKQLVGDQQAKTQSLASPAHSSSHCDDITGQKVTSARSFGASRYGELSDSPRFPQFNQGISPGGDHQSHGTSVGLDEQPAVVGDYDNPGLLVPKVPNRTVTRLAEEFPSSSGSGNSSSGSRSRHASGETRQASTGPSTAFSQSSSGSRSRHASGETRQASNRPTTTSPQSSKNETSREDLGRERLVGNVAAHSLPHSEEEQDQSMGLYDYVDSDRSRSTGFVDYSDCSLYSDASSSGGCTGDSDSGCYSHYQQPRGHPAVPPKPSFYRDLSQSISGAKSSGVSPSRQQQQPKQSLLSTRRPQSPDRFSAELRCDQEDLTFQQVGSSARTLATHHQHHLPHHPHNHQQQQLHQQVSSPPRPLPAAVHQVSVPTSPVPQRRSPSRILPIRVDNSPSPTHPIASSTPNSTHSRNYSVIQKNNQAAIQDTPKPAQKLNLKARWPPVSSSEELQSPNSAGGKQPSAPIVQHHHHQAQQSGSIHLSKPKPFQHPARDSPSGNTQHSQQVLSGDTQANTQANTPQHPTTPQRVPDLSVLISELRSAAGDCGLGFDHQTASPTSPYKSTARSESRSQTQSPVRTQAATRSEPQSPVTRPKFLANQAVYQHHLQQQHKVGSRSAGQSPVRQQPHTLGSLQGGSRPDSPWQQEQKRVAATSNNSLSPWSRAAEPQPTHGVKHRGRSTTSPEHDYEPIETLQLEVPATPRPQPKFPHPQGLTATHSAMTDTGGQGQGQTPKHVKALFNFKGANNDELCFKKGEVITVTQCVEGGWWEGTLNGRTGWFPSNYTKEIKADLSYKNHKSGEVPVYKRESMQLYHNMVLKNVIETEKAHVEEMTKVLQSYIKPIQATNILSQAEYSTLIGNMKEIITFQQSFLSALEECEKLPLNQRRIGGIFMQFAPSMKELHSSYCANHPQAVSLLQKRREELSKFVESQGASSPGAQALTTILSKPFVRLDKYPSLLKELERHVEESHPDRGDTQRAIAVYKNIANSCLDIRKLKEMEHEIITSTIQGWEGEEISKLGEVIHLSQVKMITQTGEKFERIFVLFPSCLVMLSMSTRLSSYQYEGKIPLSGLNAAPTENPESYPNAFEISGPMIEKITVLCGTRLEVSAWLDILRHQLSQSGFPPSSTPSSSSSSSGKSQHMQVHMISTCQSSVSSVTPAKTAQISLSSSSSSSNTAAANTNLLNNNNVNTNPASVGPSPPHFPAALVTKGLTGTTPIWSLTCLRPSPPLRPTLMCREEVLKSPRAARKSTHKRKPVRTYSGEEADWYNKQHDPKVYNEDAFILQVIEAYCNSIKTRHTVNSCKIEVAPKKPQETGKAVLNSPQILLAEDEKIFDETEQQERTVVDTVYALQDRVKELEQEQRRLRVDVEEERRCRRKLELLVKQQINKLMTCGVEADGTGAGISDHSGGPSSQDGVPSQDGGS